MSTLRWAVLVVVAAASVGCGENMAPEELEEDGTAELELASVLCGSSYDLKWSMPLRDDASTPIAGWLRVFYSASRERNCAVTLKSKRTKSATSRMVGIRLSSESDWTEASDTRAMHAGPVYSRNSRGRCIDVKGCSDGVCGGDGQILCG